MTEAITNAINNPTSQLTAGITSGSTSLSVTAPSAPDAWPTTGTFRILIGLELITVTAASGSATTLTVVNRGVEGTTAASHSSSDPIDIVLSKTALTTYLDETRVTSVAKSGSAALHGAVTLTGGTNVTLTQAAQDISIAASFSGVSSLAKSGSGALTGAVTLSEGTNITLTQSGNDISIASSPGTGVPGADGWAAISGTLTYSSADAPVYVATTSVDLSGTIPLGARVKLTQTTTRYFIVVAIDATTITLYGGGNTSSPSYTLANAAISSPYYSIFKAPYGFPMDPATWTYTVTDTSDRSQASPTNGTWYNLGSISIAIPIGCWRVAYWVVAEASRASAGVCAIKTTLSTANNSSSDTQMETLSQYQSAEVTTFNLVSREKFLTLTTKTTHYLNGLPNATGHNAIDFRGDVTATKIQAICAYL